MTMSYINVVEIQQEHMHTTLIEDGVGSGEEDAPRTYQDRDLAAVALPPRFEPVPFTEEAVVELPLASNNAALGELIYYAGDKSEPAVLRALLVSAIFHMLEGLVEVRHTVDMDRPMGSRLPPGTPIYLLKLALIGACGMVKTISNENQDYLPQRWGTLVKAMESAGTAVPPWNIGNPIPTNSFYAQASGVATYITPRAMLDGLLRFERQARGGNPIQASLSTQNMLVYSWSGMAMIRHMRDYAISPKTAVVALSAVAIQSREFLDRCIEINGCTRLPRFRTCEANTRRPSLFLRVRSFPTYMLRPISGQCRTAGWGRGAIPALNSPNRI